MIAADRLATFTGRDLIVPRVMSPFNCFRQDHSPHRGILPSVTYTEHGIIESLLNLHTNICLPHRKLRLPNRNQPPDHPAALVRQRPLASQQKSLQPLLTLWLNTARIGDPCWLRDLIQPCRRCRCLGPVCLLSPFSSVLIILS